MALNYAMPVAAFHVVCGDDLSPAATAKALAHVANGYGTIFAGKHGVGGDNQQVGVLLAQELGMPHVSVVVSLEPGDGKVIARREIEGGLEVVECPLPAVFTCQKGLNEPRYPSLKGIMQARKKPLTEIPLADTGAPQEGLSWRAVTLPPPRQAGRILEGEPREQVAELVRILREEVKVIA